tara:strand:+ start:187 stop:561 length:375 start_codon:yes stop_codon:yes gene_type:complete
MNKSHPLITSAYNLCIIHAVLASIIILYAFYKKYKFTSVAWTISLIITLININFILSFNKDKDAPQKSLTTSIIHMILSIVMIFITWHKNKKDHTMIWIISLILDACKIVVLRKYNEKNKSSIK